ncbi:MAG: MobA/MobL family protein [Steroidobacteraceae bacterium]
MASYFLRVKHVSRGKGARVTRAAAYRAGERIRDERTSETYNYSNRADIAHKEIILPWQLADRADMGWAQDRSRLWNAAEHAGRRRNSRLATEVLVLLPPELTPAQRILLVRTFSRELAGKYRGAVDCTIHEPRSGADRRNHHAHLLMTTREVTPQGLGPRTTLELGGRERHLRGLGPSKADYLLMRESPSGTGWLSTRARSRRTPRKLPRTSTLTSTASPGMRALTLMMTMTEERIAAATRTLGYRRNAT